MPPFSLLPPMAARIPRCLPALALALLAAIPAAARAQVIVSNLTGTDNVFAGPNVREVFAQQFTVTGGTWDLTGIEAELGERDASVTSLVARLYADAANTVGAPLGTLSLSGGISTIPTTTSSYAIVTFTPDTPLVLAAGSSYWFALGPTNVGTVFWSGSGTADNINTGAFGTVNSRFGASLDAGASYDLYLTSGALHMAVNSTPVITSDAAPEPVTLVLFASGLLPILGQVIRKRRKA